ncbi:MAG: transcriptional repressor LexA [Aggregatilineales bacterium]
MKTFEKLSPRQQNILRFIDRYIIDNSYPPTIRDIGEATKIASTSVVNYNLNKLVDAGFLERSASTSRGLKLVKPIPGSRKKVAKTSQIMSVAHVGQIAAGEPIAVPTQMPDPENVIEVTSDMLGGADTSEVFALTVRGDSMIDAMIQDGDIVLFRTANTANNGEMVAVWLEDRGETTMKYFYKEGDKVRLQPAHPTMDAIVVDARNCKVQGKVLSVFRRMKK